MAEVANLHAVTEVVEHLVGDRFSAGGQFTHELDPLGPVENFLGLLGGGVREQKRCEALQLGRDLSVRAGEQLVDTGLHRACQTMCAADEEIDLSAAFTDPVPFVTGARATDFAAGVINTDQRTSLLAAGAGRRRAPKLPVARSAYRPQGQRGLYGDGALAQGAWSWAAVASAAG
jgi:hypothetical protein